MNAFAQVVEAGAQAGADCVLIETMNDLYEAKAAVLAAKEHCSLPVFVTMTFDEEGKLLTGGTLEAAAAVLEGLGVDALGLNCGLGPQQMLSSHPAAAAAHLPAHFGGPQRRPPPGGGGPHRLRRGAGGVRRVDGGDRQGGGPGPGRLLRHHPCPHRRPHRPVREALSPARSPLPADGGGLGYGGRLLRPGGRCSSGSASTPQGSPSSNRPLREKNIAYMLGEGIAQQDAGAHVLDVNVGLPEIDEPELMCQVIRELQGVTPLPLQIDTADPVTMEKALRLYNGKALVNSVTAKASSMEAIFPLVRKYGGVVIGLTITEEGIPETAQGRLEAARLIVETAQSYGIAKKDLVIDPPHHGGERRGGRRPGHLGGPGPDPPGAGGLHLPGGVQRVLRPAPAGEGHLRFLPDGPAARPGRRHHEPQVPGHDGRVPVLQGAHRKDPNCMDYIAAYGESAPAPAAPAQTGYTLQEAIVKGLKDQAYARGQGAGGLPPGAGDHQRGDRPRPGPGGSGL